ncbi:MAG TPA: FAD-dependent oxidoreductase [Gammaproteobacteria bacterium]|nr:FAD-dependent oxidoreductase [Gammaproteobacteria bacterium]
MIKKTGKKVIIIGAGIAGLAACSKLSELGFDARILEARNRAGGRIETDHSLGIPFGKGAGWIHGDENNPMTELAKQFNAKMAPIDSSQFSIFDKNGLPIPNNVVEKFKSQFDKYLKDAKKSAYHSTSDISLSTALNSVIESEKFSTLEKTLFDNKLKGIEGYEGASTASLSARVYGDAAMWPGKNCFLTTSYQPIVEGLAKKCRIDLNTTVKEINLLEKNVEIVTHHSTYIADYVVITLPLGVLQKNIVKFNPSLPENKLKAIQSLGMGLFNITAMKFPKMFWAEESHALFFTQFDKLSTSVFFNLGHFISQPVLVGYSGGQTALQLESFSDEELITKIMKNFQNHFNTALPDPDSFIITRWSQDPFSYGSYSYLKTGSTCMDYEIIAEPIYDKLFFAGEATCSTYPSTTHGAYLSGIREAERINNLSCGFLSL